MAHWIIEDRGFGGQYYRCSRCNQSWNDLYYNISMDENCPNCRAPIDIDKTEYLEKEHNHSKVVNRDSVADWSPARLLDHILKSPTKFPKDYTYVILGRVGPTGKTWLTKELNNRGYKAFDLTESMYNLIDYPNDSNDYRIDQWQKFVTIVLNRRIK